MRLCAWCEKEMPEVSPSRQTETCSRKCGALLRWHRQLGDKPRRRQKAAQKTQRVKLKPWPCQICGKMVDPYMGKQRVPRKGKGCCRSHSTKIAMLEGCWHTPNPPNSWGPSNTNWKGGRKKQGGYIYVLAPPDHPTRGRKTGRRRYIAEHRLIMEQHLGRHLEDWEKVHHKNAIRDDNRIENLQIVTLRIHKGQVLCPHCHKWFVIN